ncbi:hypothetical protein PoB_003998700 [Plakobranchus ocellatus]|uniref:Ig-like domain-containing protein n=1 Tax=Plakobranchus ocellatus TaxID=259542 RepID=A0AAV4B2P1_9GAST|nr:hypothetical protein PoB_003998700 [Plakobranchus ocellatus]
MHPKIQNATLKCYSDTEEGFFQHPDTGENITTVASNRLPPVVIFAIGLPDLKIREDDEGKYVVAKCSADVGPDGVLQWELLVSDWLNFCWIVDTEAKVSGSHPPFMSWSNYTNVDLIVYSDVTGPRIISEVKFMKPQGWKESNLRCNVDNPDRDNIIRPEDKPKMKAYKPCKKIEYI